ncbi:putative non-specific serine/threonine protein kinase [Lupinus albus]|uniref:Serine/threonine-protein kinase RIO2 n=1 Tax=Lupinus albus TaxID=3870 RepID=A0A6A4Q3V9_LUPAL|nr:putative non-specific serine/threonine protein kinase [Lupinus albus]
MKLDVDVLRYLSKDDFRVLTAVELGMRNHEIVPSELIARIARLKHGGTYKVLKNLLKHKLLHHDSSKYDGFRLTYLGYDFLAIKTMVNKGVFVAVGRQIGVGKESDIFEVAREDGTILCMKLHRLGRVSFRAVKQKRDYLRHRSSFNWLYLSRLAALKEFAFMKALEAHGFPVPNAIEQNRHCVIMSLVQGYPLVQVKQLQNTDIVFETIIGIVVRLAEHGLIHCDFNEFNIMIDDDEKITMIDFPQMVSVSHRNAQMYFDRDVECIFKFFRKRFNISFKECIDDVDGSDEGRDEGGKPSFCEIERSDGFLDRELAASGFSKKDEEHIQRFIEGGAESDINSDGEGADSVEDVDEANSTDGDSSHLLEQDSGNENGGKDESCEAGENSSSEKEDATSEKEEEEKNEDDMENEAELVKSLNKQRQRAIKAANRGGRKSLASRNSYKDKGGRSSNNSKIQNQLSSW